MRLAAGMPRLGDAEVVASPGERTFRSVCMACHAVDERSVGPPLTEIVEIYAGNPDGLIAWVKKPGRKGRAIPRCRRSPCRRRQYRAVADYILDEVFAPANYPRRSRRQAEPRSRISTAPHTF